MHVPEHSPERIWRCTACGKLSGRAGHINRECRKGKPVEYVRASTTQGAVSADPSTAELEMRGRLRAERNAARARVEQLEAALRKIADDGVEGYEAWYVAVAKEALTCSSEPYDPNRREASTGHGPAHRGEMTTEPMRPTIIAATAALAAVALPATADARDPYPKSAGTVCKNAVVKAHYSARYYRVQDMHGTRTPGRNIRRYGLNGHRKSKCKHLRRSSRTFKRWLAPPPAPVAQGDTSSASAAPPYAGGAYSIPSDIVMCESGGDYGAVNPSSGAYGAYQIMPSTAAALGCDLSSPAGQDQCAAEIMATQGRGAWVC